MSVYSGANAQLEEQPSARRLPRSRREADRIKAVVLLATGWSVEDGSAVLQVDANALRKRCRRYQQRGVEALGEVAYRGSACARTPAKLELRDVHLQNDLYQTAKAIAHWVEQRFGVSYTESRITAVLHRLGYVYKKPKLVPGKADPLKRKAFLDGCESSIGRRAKRTRSTSWTRAIRSTIR